MSRTVHQVNNCLVNYTMNGPTQVGRQVIWSQSFSSRSDMFMQQFLTSRSQSSSTCLLESWVRDARSTSIAHLLIPTAKIGHAFKDALGTSSGEFEGKMGAIKNLKIKILESAQAAFQQKTFVKFDGLSFSSPLSAKLIMGHCRGARNDQHGGGRPTSCIEDTTSHSAVHGGYCQTDETEEPG